MHEWVSPAVLRRRLEVRGSPNELGSINSRVLAFHALMSQETEELVLHRLHNQHPEVIKQLTIMH